MCLRVMTELVLKVEHFFFNSSSSIPIFISYVCIKRWLPIAVFIFTKYEFAIFDLNLRVCNDETISKVLITKVNELELCACLLPFEILGFRFNILKLVANRKAFVAFVKAFSWFIVLLLELGLYLQLQVCSKSTLVFG